MKIIFSLVTALTMLTTNPVSARKWPDAGGWTVLEGDDYCVMTSEFEGNGSSRLGLLLDANGTSIISDTNLDWIIVKGQTYADISVVMGDDQVQGTSTGIEIEGSKGFALRMGPNLTPKFIADIAQYKTIRMFKGEQQIDRLTLEGSGAGVAMTQRCLASVRAKIAEQKRVDDAEQRKLDKTKDLPRDPFAKAG